jgi:hypothetical protein
MQERLLLAVSQSLLHTAFEITMRNTLILLIFFLFTTRVSAAYTVEVSPNTGRAGKLNTATLTITDAPNDVYLVRPSHNFPNQIISTDQNGCTWLSEWAEWQCYDSMFRNASFTFQYLYENEGDVSLGWEIRPIGGYSFVPLTILPAVSYIMNEQVASSASNLMSSLVSVVIGMIPLAIGIVGVLVVTLFGFRWLTKLVRGKTLKGKGKKHRSKK